MNSWLKKFSVLIAASALLITGCGNANTSVNNAGQTEEVTPTEQKLKVVTSFYPMYEFSKQVGGEHADVVSLVPVGTEPHDWEPSAKDMALISDANIFVYNGIVEEWAEKAIGSTSNANRIVVEASHGLNLMEGEAHDHTHEEEVTHEHEEGEEAHDHEEDEVHTEEDMHGEAQSLDPHVWLSPVLAQQQVTAILEAFVKADPANEAEYKKNADAYIAKLQALDEEFKTGLKDVKKKEFVTQHEAFGYLAKEYGLTQVAIAGLSPEQEPAPDTMAEIVKFAKEHNVSTFFFETLVDPKVAETVANEIGASTAVLNPLEGLTKEEANNQMDYISVMKKNLEVLIKALGE